MMEVYSSSKSCMPLASKSGSTRICVHTFFDCPWALLCGAGYAREFSRSLTTQVKMLHLDFRYFCSLMERAKHRQPEKKRNINVAFGSTAVDGRRTEAATQAVRSRGGSHARETGN